MTENITHVLSVRWVDKLCRHAPANELDQMKMILGLEIILINTTKLAVIFTVSIALGMLKHTVAVMLGFALVKRWAFGLHAKRSTTCTAVSLCAFVLTPYLLRGMSINNFAICGMLICVMVLLGKYAPADTKERPLVGEKKRRLLKIKTVAAGLVVLMLGLLIPDKNFSLLLVIGTCFETVTILPVTYKLLNRKERNYEAYE